MKNKTILFIILFFAFLLACSTRKPAARENAYTPPDKALYDTITRQDSLLFAAFNARDLERMITFFDTTLEVYQDNVGMRDYEQSVEAFRQLFQKEYVLTRQPDKESLEIYPVKDYGAIETGRHTFCHPENGKQVCGTFKFLHIWERKNAQWKITRIVTYDHR